MKADSSDRNDVEALVGRYLQGQERPEDAARMLAGVRSKLTSKPNRGPRIVRTAARWSVVAAAAFLILGYTWTFRQASAKADAVRLVREARDALGTTPVDRAYRIEVALAPGMAERSPVLAALGHYDCRLWTRSDRFWIEGRHEAQVWACGRDPKSHAWVASTSGIGLDFAPEDVPEPLDEALELFNFDLDSTLHILSTAFDVKVLDEGSGSSPGLTRIQGTPLPDHPRPRLRSITVEIDERTKTVRRVILSRAREGHPTAEVSFTYDRAESQPESAYQLADHLEPGATTFGPDRRLRRRRELVRFFGSLILKGE